jgi:Spy/CpxP family protein refolding chaperone
MLSKSKLSAVGLLAAVAVAGFAAGFATSSWAGGRDAGGRERPSWSARLTRDLALTPAQSDSVRQILQRHRTEMREVFESVRPRMDSVRLRINDEIRTVLTPDQARAYEELLQRERDRVARWRADTAAHDRGGRGGH